MNADRFAALKAKGRQQIAEATVVPSDSDAVETHAIEAFGDAQKMRQDLDAALQAAEHFENSDDFMAHIDGLVATKD